MGKSQFTCVHKMGKNNRNEWKKLNELMNGWINTERNIFFQYGFEILGPLLVGFCKWLHKQAKDQKFNRLFFLSRDGYLMLKAYRILFAYEKIPISYLYISRKVAREAQLWLKPDLAEVIKHFPQYSYLECGEFCEKFNIEGEEAVRIWKDCGLEENMKFFPEDFLQDKRLSAFYDRMRPKILEESQKNYAKITEYLHQKQFTGKVGIVDIGWKGTIQNCLEVIIKNDVRFDCDLVGCYLGLSEEAADAGNKLSFINPAEEPQEFDAGFIEYPFLAPEGTVIGYSCDSVHTIKPVLAEYEYDLENREIAQNMQEGALYFLEQAKGYLDGEFIWDATFSYENLKRISKHPTVREVNIFGDLACYERVKREIAAPKSIRYYMTHMKELPYDLSISSWRIGFLKRLFKIGLDYNKMLKMYKNMRQTERI